MTAVIGGSIVGAGLLTGLVIVDVPLALTAGAAFGLMGVLGAYVRLRDFWRSRAARFHPGYLTGPQRVALCLLALAAGSCSASLAAGGALAWSIACGALAAVLGLWALTVRTGRPLWTYRDEAILRGDLSMTAWEKAGQAGQARRGGRR
jgi:hypothetical protein